MALSSPQEIQAKLEAIEQDMALRQNDYETAAQDYYDALRERKYQRACFFHEANGGTVAEREAFAEEKSALIGIKEEPKYMALKAVMETLAERASILQSLLKMQR